jgi:GTP cyclohydrolase I
VSEIARTFVTWGSVLRSLSGLEELVARHGGLTVYGVPRGGAIVAGLLAARCSTVKITEDPSQAEAILDDIIDSGRTREQYGKLAPGVPFVALVDKRKQLDLGWVVFPWERRDETSDIEDTVVRQLQFIGEDATREGLRDTPRRHVSALREFTSGLQVDAAALLRSFDAEGYDEIVALRDVEFVSLCEHHLLPFTGRVHFAYLPSDRIVGLSKIPRMIDALARRPQVQERLTHQIASTFAAALSPRGVAVVVEGEHTCMALRGARAKGRMVTSVVTGVFRDKPEARAEVMALLQGRR